MGVSKRTPLEKKGTNEIHNRVRYVRKITVQRKY
jgi:hypothetical protein